MTVSKCPVTHLTMNNDAPVADNQNSLTAGARDPVVAAVDDVADVLDGRVLGNRDLQRLALAVGGEARAVLVHGAHLDAQRATTHHGIGIGKAAGCHRLALRQLLHHQRMVARGAPLA